VNNKLWQSLANSWKVPELRKKLLFTAAMIAIYRFGAHVPVPGVNLQALNNLFQNGSGGVLGFLNLFSGGALNKVAIFALGIMPYITASIIMQLLTVVIPKLEELQKEGEQGQKVITQYSRYLTVILAAVQSVGYIFLFRSQGALPNLTVVRFALILFTLTAGATAVMWIGELITARGIGNGMSILIFISIISRVPGGAAKFFEGSMSLFSQVGFVVIALGVIVAVIWITTGERRIPVQYAKRIVGRRMMGEIGRAHV
jgi:preprotein translocase subunit SecY